MSKNGNQKFLFLTSVLCLLLSGCGFSPIYGSHPNNADVAAELNQIAIANIPERHGQMLRNNLIDRMYGKGRPQAPKYALSTTLRATETGIGVLPNSVTTLTELNIYADYVLTAADGRELMRATAHALVNYDQPGEQFTTLTAHDTAYRNGLKELSEQIVNRVSLYFAEYSAADGARQRAEREKAERSAGNAP